MAVPPAPAPVAYLDHAATTPLLPAAVEAMVPLLGVGFGNPSGVHRVARAARAALDDARDRLAAVLGAGPHELVLTGGGTEAINLAMQGLVARLATRDPSGRPLLLTSAIEHDAVRNTAAWLGTHGRARHVELPVTPEGVLDLVALRTLLDERVAQGDPPALVAVMAVNNEVGTVQPVAEVAAIVRAKAPGARLLVDAVQALPWLDLRPITAVADLVAVSAHKHGGPKGIGALVVRNGTVLEPLLHGGGQEQERRSGTQNVAGAVAMAVAAEHTEAHRAAEIVRISSLRDRLLDGLLTAVDGCTETVPRAAKVAGSAHVCIEGVESESLLVLLDRDGVAASAGSACASGAIHASPVLLAMGVPEVRALGSLRLSLGAASTDDEIDRALAVIPAAVRRLRGAS